MPRRPPTVAGFRVLAVGVAVALLARPTAAHEVGGTRFDAPLPLTWLFTGAGATVALTAVWLAVTDRRPKASGTTRRLAVPSALEDAGRFVVRPLFVLTVLAAVVIGVLGRQVAAENAATVFVWPVCFRGLALVAVLVGSPWPLLSPWRSAYRGLSWLEGRELALRAGYPAGLGDWPAFVGFIVLLGVVENLTAVPSSPRLTAVVVACYAAAMLGGGLVFGVAWFRRADPLGVLYRLFGRVAPVSFDREADGATVVLRSPWRACRKPVETLALAGFAVAAVYTVSFDGFTSTRTYVDLLSAARQALGPGLAAPFLLYAIGLGVFLVTFVAASTLVEHLGNGDVAGSWRAATRAFAPTVLPIAAAYEVAHNYPFVLRNLGQLWGLAVGRLVAGAQALDLLWWLSLPAFWWSQVILVVAGHVVAVVAAHLAAVDRYGSVETAQRAHLPLVAVMVAYTVLSLWIISQPVVR